MEKESTLKGETNANKSPSQNNMEMTNVVEEVTEVNQPLEQSCHDDYDKTDSNDHISESAVDKCFQNLGLDLDDDDDEIKPSNKNKDKHLKGSIKHSKVLPQRLSREEQFHLKERASFALKIHEDLADPKHPQKRKSLPQSDTLVGRLRNRFSISYESLVWTIFTVVTILCIVDHFVLNGDAVLGRSGKLPQRIWGTNVGETTTNVVWAVTARLIITSQNLMFYTALWCIPNIITEFAPRWLTTDGIRDVHVRIHTLAGIFLIAVPSLAHVLVVLIPPIVDGTAIMYYPPSHFNYSKYRDHLNWTKFWDPAAVENWTFNDRHGVHLTSDELYRLSLMVVLFCFLFPLTRSNYANERSYSAAMALHTFAGVWYAIDNIRKITHGLAHMFNLPVFVIWCLDRVVSVWCYRRNRGHVVRQKIIGNMEYVVIYMKLDKGVKPGVGDVYYILQQLKQDQKTLPQRAHPFTTFSNMSRDPAWDIGFIITIMEDDKQLCQPWTRWIVGADPSQTFTVWGPYRSTAWKLYNKLKGNDLSPAHFVLFATGSGFGYLLDVLSFLAYKTEESTEKQSQSVSKIDIFFSVRCKAFYHFFGKRVDDLIKKIHQKKSAEVTFKFNVTHADEKENTEEQMKYSGIQLSKGRIDFEKALKQVKKDTCCFFVGRPTIAEKIEKLCNDKGMKLYKDYTNSRAKERDRHLFIKYLKISFVVVISIVIFCAVASIYIDTKQIKEYIHKRGVNDTN